MKYLAFVAYFLIQWLMLTTSDSATKESHRIPEFSPVARKILHWPSIFTRTSSISDDLKTFFYTQTLDHFNYGLESYTTFQQRYFINFKCWGGANSSAPIFVYLGAEAPLDLDLGSIGFLPENAPRFRALQVYIEHRYYGESIPFGSTQEAMKNESTRAYFNSAQAIADYAEVIVFLKGKLSAPNSPVIVIGLSYGGMLASWFRLKYPHIAYGALASSAPILYFDDITPQNAYHAVVTKDFRDTSERCYQTIKRSWLEIDRVAAKSNGLLKLSQIFKSCSPLKSSQELKDYLELVYEFMAQYDNPPTSGVWQLCHDMDVAEVQGADILERIAVGLGLNSSHGRCTNVTLLNPPEEWNWQVCSELVIPISNRLPPAVSNDNMFSSAPFNLSDFIKQCKSLFGVPPRPHWITTNYGGHDVKLVLHRFASNIIFSNGLRDPYSSGGVLENISDSVLAIYTSNDLNFAGAHCADVLPSDKTDPEWSTMQRNREVDIINGWIRKYYVDLQALKKPHKNL